MKFLIIAAIAILLISIFSRRTALGAAAGSYRSRKREFEARLTSTTGGRISGKVEWEGHDETPLELELDLYDADDYEGKLLTLSIDGSSVGNVTVHHGRGELKLRNKTGAAAIPAVREGQEAIVSLDGATILQGRFVID